MPTVVSKSVATVVSESVATVVPKMSLSNRKRATHNAPQTVHCASGICALCLWHMPGTLIGVSYG